MQEHGSPYLRIDLLLTLLLVPLATAQCAPRQVWGLPLEGLRADLAGGRYGALSGVDFSSRNPGDALTISAEAPFYLSFVFDSLNRPSQALSMLELAATRSPSPWREEASALLAERYNLEHAWDDAAAAARRLLSAKPPPALEQRARRALVEALYWSRDDTNVLAESAQLPAPDPEVLLFRAVSSLRLGLPGAHDLVMSLFLDQRVSVLHQRFAEFLSNQPAYQPLFSAQDRDVIEGKYQLQQGAWAKALPLLEGVLDGVDPAPFAHSALLMDMGNAYVSAGRTLAGGAFMAAMAPHLVGQARVDALEQAGRLLRRARDYGRAQAALQAAAMEASQPAQRDRARWQLLDILFSLSPADLFTRVHAESLLWGDPSYFSDLLEDRIAREVSARQWSALSLLRTALLDRGPDDVLAELDYVLGRAWQEGRIRQLAPGMGARSLFVDAVQRQPGGYYGILAASMLGEIPDRTVAGTDAEDTPGTTPLDPVAMGFLSFGLHDQAYTRVWAARAGLANPQLVEVARRFATAGDLRSSQYLVGALARRRRLTAAELTLYYPRGYETAVEQLAQDDGIQDHLLYALVREESYFDAEVVSSAGAVGLTQLLPATAAPLAHTLHIADPDLTDPGTNLAIGVRHLRDLMKDVDSPTKALLAYNAGLSRVRQWERAAPGLPADLFIESVPIAESRGYVRKILVSTVMYAFLYHDVDPREAALSFFGLSQGPLDSGDSPAPIPPASR